MKRFIFAMVAILVTGCGESVAPPTQHSQIADNLTFYRFDSAARAAAVAEASFWAVRGQDRALELRYADNGSVYMRFEVDARSLDRLPDDSVIQEGDSVLITVRAGEDGRFMFRFQPSGLKFSSDQPARLTLDHSRTDRDLDGDGVVTADDALLASRAGIWKQELSHLPWMRIPMVQLGGNVVRADVQDFTGFGMAVN